jgi:hypothetical protein
VHYQPCGRSFKQDARPVGACPAQRVQPTGEAKARSLIGKLDIAVNLSNFRRVQPALFAGAISRCVPDRLDAELFGQRMQDGSRHVHRIFQKNAKITNSAQLNGKTDPIVPASPSDNQRMVGIIQMKVAGEILKRRGPAVTTVVFALCG